MNHQHPATLKCQPPPPPGQEPPNLQGCPETATQVGHSGTEMLYECPRGHQRIDPCPVVM